MTRPFVTIEPRCCRFLGEASTDSHTEDEKFPKFEGSDPEKKERPAWVALKRHCSCDAQEVDAADDVLFHVFWG